MVPEKAERQIRFRFEKTGRLKYISHLDLNRTMKSAVRRAGILLAHSHGFNPRPKIVFALPLSVGTESVCEYMDLGILSDGAPRELMEALNRNLPDEIRIRDAYFKAADFSRIAWAEYEIVMKYPGADTQTAQKIMQMADEPMIVRKRTKSSPTGYKEMDIAPFVKKIEAQFDGFGIITVTALLCASNENYINPEYLVSAIKNSFNVTFEDPRNEYYTVKRCGMYLQDAATLFH